ncbi:MAG: hypothetical protein PHI31_01290 [Desulfuromonadaceae bacterium]|nr:hypothetical protein [Desulfuromonadaceae bacterium]
MKSIWLCVIILTASFLAACGSAGTGQVQTVPYTVATISLSANAISGITPAAPLQAVRVTVQLPQGASITDVTKAVSGRAGQLDAGTLSYSTAARTVSFTVTGSEIKLGDIFADIRCDLASGSTLDANSFLLANQPTFPFLEMSGLDVTNGTTVNLASQINIAMAVVLQ